MVLGLLKWLKETRFYKRKKKIIIETWTLYSMQEIGRRRSLHDDLRNEKSYIFVLKREKEQQKKEYIFFSMDHCLLVAKEP